MRIVLTNAGQIEINNDVYNNQTNIPKKFKSQPKVYIKKNINNPNIKNNIKRFNKNKSINHNISHILTEKNYLNDIIKNKNDFKKENSSLKINTENNKNNNFQLIKVANSNPIPKEIKELYLEGSGNYAEESKIINIDEALNKKMHNHNSLIMGNNSFPLKDLLKTKNAKFLNQNLLYKEINKNEKHLIDYLKSDRNIKPSFMEKINKANDKKLVKLDKICQIYFNNEKRNEYLQQNRKDRIKLGYNNDSKFCRESLLNMGKDIQNSKIIIKSLSNKKDKYYSLTKSNDEYMQ